MNVKITNREVIALHQALLSVGNLRGAKFAYAVGKNQDKTTGILKLLQKTTEPYPEYKDADQARIELCKQFAAKDDKGNPITEQSHNGPQFKIANQADFDTALEAFKESHKDVLAARQKQLDDVEKLLDEEIELDVHLLKAADLPADISAGQLAGIVKMVED